MRAVQPHDDGAGERRNAKAGNQTRAGGDAIGRLLGYLGIIIQEAEESVGEGDNQRDPDIGVLKVAPERDRHNEARPDQEAAHGGRSLLRELGFQRQIADRLALALARTQEVDQPVTDQHRHQKCRDDCRTCAEGNVVQQIEEAAVRSQQFIQHQLTLAALLSRHPSCPLRPSGSIGAAGPLFVPSRTHSTL